MKLFKTTILATTLILGMTSCKDFLDVTPGNSIDANTPFATATDARNRLNGLNRLLVSSSYYGRNFILYGDVKGGDMSVYSQGRGLDALYSFNHSATTNSFEGFWSVIYNCINQSNDILEKIEAAQQTGGTENYNNAKGQALTLRALLYFDLVKLYAKTYSDAPGSFGVPLLLKTSAYNNKPTRSTVKEVYDQIVKDLTDGQALLINSKAKDPGYINYYGNLAIQSRVYLTMANYDKAFDAAKEIIGSNAYGLYENDKWVTSWASMFGNESLFELAVYEGEADLGTSSLGYYVMRRLGGQGGMFYASTPFINRMKEDATDIRLGIFGRDESSASRMGSVFKYLGSVNTATALPLNSIGDKGSTNNTAVNIKVIRLSEIYLIAAEAAMKKTTPDLTSAVTYLNAIHKRSPGLAAFTTATITEDAVLKEKSKELFGEGVRYWDMIRLNKSIAFDDAFGGLNISTRPNPMTRSYYRTILPIPQSELNANTNLVAQQNPEY